MKHYVRGYLSYHPTPFISPVTVVFNVIGNRDAMIHLWILCFTETRHLHVPSRWLSHTRALCRHVYVTMAPLLREWDRFVGSIRGGGGGGV